MRERGDSGAREARAARDAGVLAFGHAAASLSRSLALLIVVRLLGKAELGVLVAVQLFHDLVTLVATAGFPAAVMYFLPGRPEAERAAIVGRMVGVLRWLGVGAGVVLAGIAGVDAVVPGVFAGFAGDAGAHVSLVYLTLMALMPVFDLPSRIVPNVLVVEGRARTAAALHIGNTLGRTLSTVVPVALGVDLWWVVGSMLAWSVVWSTWALRLVGRRGGTSVSASGVASGSEAVMADPPVTGVPTAGELLRFAMPMGLQEIVGMLNQRLDRLLLVFLGTAVWLAEYEAGAWQIPFVVSIPYAVGAAWTPLIREAYVRGDAAGAIALWRTSTVRVAMVVIPATLPFVVAAEPLVRLLFTSRYELAVEVFRWYAIFTLGRVTTFGSVLVAAGRPGWIPLVSMGSLAANVAISVPLYLWLGPVGPAVGTALAFVPEVWLYATAIGRASGVPPTRTFPLWGVLRVLGVATVPAVLAELWRRWVSLPDAWEFAGVAVAIWGGYALLGTATGLIGRSDWRFVRGWVTFRVLRRGDGPGGAPVQSSVPSSRSDASASTSSHTT